MIRITKDGREVEKAASLKLIAKLNEDAGLIAALADEVKAGINTRIKTESKV